MKKGLILVLIAGLVVGILAGCGVAESKWKGYIGTWVRNDDINTQIEIKQNGETFLVTQYSGILNRTAKNDFIAKPQGEVLVVSFMGTEMPLIFDKKDESLSFSSGNYHRQKPEEVPKLDELKKRMK